MAADNVTSTMQGSVQKYYNAKMMNLPSRTFDTPLANSDSGLVATIPKHQGQFAEFRIIDRFSPTPTSATDSTPITYDQSTEPTTGIGINARVIQVPLDEISDRISLGHFLTMTDPIDLVAMTFDQFVVLIRRYVHRLTNSAFVKAPSDKNSFATGSLAAPFKTIYAGVGLETGGGSFSDLTQASYFTMQDFINARSLLENGGVPRVKGAYDATISDAIANQLMDDPGFRDVIKRHGSLTSSVFEQGKLPMYAGMRWKVQDDEYRTQLPESGGLIGNRSDTGRVHFAHVTGMESYGYVDLAGKQRLSPKLKVQDITTTGINTTIGFRIPTKSSVINTDFGVNIAGTSKYYTTLANITG